VTAGGAPVLATGGEVSYRSCALGVFAEQPQQQTARGEGAAVFGIEGYEPQWHHSGRALAAAHRSRFRHLIGQRLHGAWLMWDMDADRWFADGPIILGFDDANVEVTHRKFDDCAITWDQVDMLAPLHWSGIRLDWREEAHPALRSVHGRRLREVNVVERLMAARWRPTVLHAVEFLFEGGRRLAIFNALDENGLTDATEVDLPVGRWRRVPIA
jgi:hypothetical protein